MAAAFESCVTQIRNYNDDVLKSHSLDNLSVLWLNRTNVSDTALEHLSQMKSLRLVDPHRAQVASDGISRPQKPWLHDAGKIRQLGQST